MKKSSSLAVWYAILAAVFYALNIPFSKLLLQKVPAAFLAGFLYLGAGIGVGLLSCFRPKNAEKAEKLTKSDLPYTLGMIVLDIAAPVFLMVGLRAGSAASASLLGNFEIVATALIALLFFREDVSKRLWLSIGLITLSSILLSFEGSGSLHISSGSLLVLLATLCWGLENNCTRRISEKDTYEIVTVKGLCSGMGSCLIALFSGESFPAPGALLLTMLLGFAAYGLSIFTYIRAQRELGAAKTSAYYAIAPFLGSFLSFLLTGEKLTRTYLPALVLMALGTVFMQEKGKS